jgi:protein-glutamine gamma-glutamyltransferase
VEGMDPKSFPGYLRGTTMERFDGERWSGGDPQSMNELPSVGGGYFQTGADTAGTSAVKQSVLLLDTSASALFSAGRPLRIAVTVRGLRLDANGTLHWGGGGKQPLRYEVISDLGPWLETDAARISDPSGPFLQLPTPPGARIAELARTVGGTGDAETIARRLVTYLRDHYGYSTDQGNSLTAAPLESFLFERKSGPCGHFSSALAVMLRLRGIPCRLVAGYLRGEWNDPAQEFIVRERDAHAWVEAYLPGQGWTTLDATPRQALLATRRPWFSPLRQYWDYLQLRWNRLVVEYDLNAQVQVVDHLRHSSDRLNQRMGGWFRRDPKRGREAESPGATGLGTFVGLLGIGLVIALGSLGFRRRRYSREDDPRIAFYLRFLHEMERAGVGKEPVETGQEYAQRLSRLKPDKAPLARRVTEDYYAVRFAQKGGPV